MSARSRAELSLTTHESEVASSTARPTHLRSLLPWDTRRSRVIVRLNIRIFHLNYHRSLRLETEFALHVPKVLGCGCGDLVCEKTFEVPLPVMIWRVG